MSLDLGKIESGRMTIRVYVGDTELEFYARTPTTEERVQYRRDIAKCFNRKGELDYERYIKVCTRWAKRILTGFREGDLVMNGEPLSPEDEKWKDVVAEKIPDIFEAICGKVFETPDAEKNLQ